MCSLRHTRTTIPDHKPEGPTFDSTIMTVMLGSTSEYSLTVTLTTGLEIRKTSQDAILRLVL